MCLFSLHGRENRRKARDCLRTVENANPLPKTDKTERSRREFTKYLILQSQKIGGGSVNGEALAELKFERDNKTAENFCQTCAFCRFSLKERSPFLRLHLKFDNLKNPRRGRVFYLTATIFKQGPI